MFTVEISERLSHYIIAKVDNIATLKGAFDMLDYLKKNLVLPTNIELLFEVVGKLNDDEKKEIEPEVNVCLS